MPTPPRKDETKEKFISRCIPIIVKEGTKPNQAAAICYSMWRHTKEATK